MENSSTSEEITPESVVVTTTRRPSEADWERAERIGAEIGCELKRRSSSALDEIRSETGRQNVIVVTATEVRLITPTDQFWFHPNMARSRIEGMLREGADRLADFMNLRIGDRVLDMTCGLGADAITASYVVGDTGCVRAVERSPVLAAIVRHGMQIYTHRTSEVVSAMRRVEVVTGDSYEILRAETSGSWDVVYFDPMFEKTLSDSQGLDVVRTLAWRETTTQASVEDARRVARRCVVMKDRAPGQRLFELGFGSVSRNGKICYGKIDA